MTARHKFAIFYRQNGSKEVLKMWRKLSLLIIAGVIIGMIAASTAVAWEMRKIVCKNPEAQKLMDQVFNILVKDASANAYKQVIPIAEKATTVEPDNDQIWVELSGDYWAYGDSLPKNTDAEKKIRQGWFEKGIAAAKKAIAIRETAGGHCWLAINLAARGEMIGIMKSIPIFPKLMKESEAADKLDPDYAHGGTARLWSEVIARVPDIAIKAVGMKPEDSIEDIQAQIKKYPLYFDNYNYMARYMMRLKKKDEALKNLEFVLSHDPKSVPDPNLVSINVEAQNNAKKLWKLYTGKDYPNK